MPPTKTAPHVLLPMNVSRVRINATKASGHHPSAGNATFIAIPPIAATGIAALSDRTVVAGGRLIVWRDVGLLRVHLCHGSLRFMDYSASWFCDSSASARGAIARR